jgi:hypothetical protein
VPVPLFLAEASPNARNWYARLRYLRIHNISSFFHIIFLLIVAIYRAIRRSHSNIKSRFLPSLLIQQKFIIVGYDDKTVIFPGFVQGNEFQFSEYMNVRTSVRAYVFVRTIRITEDN